MKMKWFLVVPACVVLSGLLQAEDPAPAALSNTRNAIVTLKVITDPKVLPLDDDLSNIRNFLSAQNVYTAGHELLGDSHTSWFKGVDVIERPKEIGGMQVARIQWFVALAEKDKPVAKEVAQSVVRSFTKHLMDEYNDNRRIYIAKADVYTRRMQEARGRLQDFIDEQNKLGQGLMDKQSMRQQLAEHEKTLVENSMQQALLKKRIEQLAKTIEELKAEADRVMSDLTKDHVPDAARIAEMQKHLEELQVVRAHPLSKEEIEDLAKVNAAKQMFEKRKEMEVNIREHQRQLADEIARLGRQQRDALMQMEELKIRENFLAGSHPGNLSSSQRYEMLEVQIEAAEENLRRAIIEKEEFETQMLLIQKPIVMEESLPPPAGEAPAEQAE